MQNLGGKQSALWGIGKQRIEIKINDTVQAFKNEYTLMHVSCTLVSVMGMYTKDYSTFQRSKGISCSQQQQKLNRYVKCEEK